MTQPIFISFYPKFEDLSESDCDKHVAIYRKWLDQHGDYGRLYMLESNRFPGKRNSVVTGLKIYEPEIATLFKLMFEI